MKIDRHLVRPLRGVATRAACALLLGPLAVAAAAEPPQPTKGLAECIEIALANRPNLDSAAAQVEGGRARVRQSWSGYLPQLNGAYGSDRRKSSFASRTQGPGTIGVLSQSTISNFHSGAVTLSQTLFDFGQNLAAIRAAYAREDSLEADAADTRKQVIYEVKQSYFDVLASQRLLAVADETVRSNRKQLEQAIGRNEVGFAPRIDVTRSEVLVAQAELDQLAARNNATVAEETLRTALGLDAPIDFALADELARRVVAIDEASAIAAAYEDRSDLQSLVAQERAADQDVAQFQRQHLPTISADASYGWSGSDYPLQDNWVFGASVNVPIFSGGLTAGRVAEARANLRGLQADERTLRQQIGLEVRRARLDVQRAAQSIDVSRARCGAGGREPGARRGALRNRRRQRDRAHRRAGAADQRGGGSRPRALRLSGGRRRARAGDRPGAAQPVNAPIATRAPGRAIPARNAAIAAAAVLALAAGLWWWLRDGADDAASYQTELVDRGPIDVEVTATGTVDPVTTVTVGSYVSGPILEIYADFNSPVETGQLVAKIDPRPYEVKVAQSEAALANAKAKVDKSRADLELKRLAFERNQKLRARNLIAENDLDTARSDYAQARAQLALDAAGVKQMEAGLAEARLTLGYTNITSPVDGVVVSRSVDVGQTVAASFQTPELFKIAQDLTKMQVKANVSESDIGGRPRRTAGDLRRRRLPRSRLRGRRRAGPQRARDGAERGDLRRDHRSGESRPRAEARHDRDRVDLHRAPRRRGARAAARAALQAGRDRRRCSAGAPTNEPVGSAVYVEDATASSNASKWNSACATSATPNCSAATSRRAPPWWWRSRVRTTIRRRPPRPRSSRDAGARCPHRWSRCATSGRSTSPATSASRRCAASR